MFIATAPFAVNRRPYVHGQRTDLEQVDDICNGGVSPVRHKIHKRVNTCRGLARTQDVHTLSVDVIFQNPHLCPACALRCHVDGHVEMRTHVEASGGYAL